MRGWSPTLETRKDYIEMVEKRYFANVDEKNIEAVLNCFHENAVFTVQSAFSTHEGRDSGIREMFSNLFNTHSKIVHRDFRHVVDLTGDCCTSRFSVENVSASDGSETYLSNCNFFYFHEGKVVQVYVYMSGGMNTLG